MLCFTWNMRSVECRRSCQLTGLIGDPCFVGESATGRAVSQNTEASEERANPPRYVSYGVVSEGVFHVKRSPKR